MNPDIVTIAISLWTNSLMDPKEMSKNEVLNELNKIQILEHEILLRKSALKAAYEGSEEKGCCL